MQQDNVEKIAESIERAFDRLVVLTTVISGVFISYMLWTYDSSIRDLVLSATSIIATLIFPLILLLFIAINQVPTLQTKEKVYSRLFGWGVLTVSFFWVIFLFLSWTIFYYIWNFDYTFTYFLSSIIVLIMLVIYHISFRNVFNFYKNNSSIKLWKLVFVYVLGIIVTFGIILCIIGL